MPVLLSVATVALIKSTRNNERKRGRWGHVVNVVVVVLVWSKIIFPNKSKRKSRHPESHVGGVTFYSIELCMETS